MLPVKKFLLGAACMLGALSAMAQSWPDIVPEMRPATRWWWLGSAVDSASLSSLIPEYARVGLGSVEITPIYGVQGNDANDIPYLSPHWMGMLGHVQDVAGSCGILVDMNQGTGWPFGGPEVQLSDAACKAVFLIDTVPHGAQPVKELPPREVPVASLMASSRRSLPDGSDEVVRAYLSRTMQRVKRAAPGGEGYVIDHFDRGAVARYLDKFDRAFSESGVPYPHNFFNDSYEVFGANWTPSLFDEFEMRRGYRLQDRLPELLGLVDDGNVVLGHYRETLAELLLENFTEQWADWAHERGVAVRNQAHGSPANLIDVYAAVDVPEIEGFGLSDFGIRGLRTDPGFTRPNDSDVSMLKYASSAAHITGKPLTSSETFTWLTEHFRTSLSQMKPDLDLMFSCGVNHVFFHGTAYSPLGDPWPGWKFYASVDMSPTNTVWRDAPALMHYIARSQSMLQQGRPDNDFLVYLPVRDLWRQRHAPADRGLMMSFSIHEMGRLAPDFIRCVMDIDSLGYDCDYISDRYLLGTRVEDGRIVTAAGTPYRALVIPGSGHLTPALQAHLDSLRADGAVVIHGVDPVLMARAAAPESMRSDLGLRVLRRADDDGHTYFIANLSDRDVSAMVPLSVAFADAAWFDPMTDAIVGAEVSADSVFVSLRSGESRFLRTSGRSLGLPVAPRMAVGAEYDFSALPWSLSFIESAPAVDSVFSLPALMPWTALGAPALDELAGTGVYSATFSVPGADPSDSWQIDLGDVRESARVYVNGQLVGTAWAAPFVLDFDGLVKPGENDIRIEVTNLPANRIAALDRAAVPWRKFKEINIVDIKYRPSDYSTWSVLPSGLNSSLVLRRLSPLAD